MCGIFGLITKPGKEFNPKSIENILKSIAKYFQLISD